MGCLYWLLVGWWLEPILLVLKMVYMLFIGLPLKFIKWMAIFFIVILLGGMIIGTAGILMIPIGLVTIVIWLIKRK